MASKLNCAFAEDNSEEIIKSMGQLTMSSKQRPVLDYQGYQFRLRYPGKNRVTWSCLRYESLSCSALVYTSSIEESEVIDDSKNIHNHAPDPVKFKLYEHSHSVKTSALTSKSEPPRKIIRSSKLSIDDEEAALLPSDSALRQKISSTKSKSDTNQYPKEPLKLADMVMPDFLTVTFNEKFKEQFLLYDSGIVNGNDRFFIFSTDEHLKLLEENHIFCDGTFDVAPELFAQVYTIHALIDGRCFPLVYMLLPKKSQQIYEKSLNVVFSSFTFLYFNC